MFTHTGRRIALWTVAIALIWAAASLAWTQYRKATDPCSYVPVGELGTRYPTLGAMLDEESRQLDLHEAADAANQVRRDAAVRSGSMSEGQALGIDVDLFDRNMRDYVAFDRRFTSECRRVTGKPIRI